MWSYPTLLSSKQINSTWRPWAFWSHCSLACFGMYRLSVNVNIRKISIMPLQPFHLTIPHISFSICCLSAPECHFLSILPSHLAMMFLFGLRSSFYLSCVECVRRMWINWILLCFPSFSILCRYASDVNSHSLLLYPFQLFGLLLPPTQFPNIRSPSSTRCQLLLNLLLCVNCTTQNPFVTALSRVAWWWSLFVKRRNTRNTDVQREDAEGCFISFDELYELICHDLQEPPV